MQSLVCTKCKFKFKKEKIPPRCPYCSELNSVQKEKSSQDLLDEVIGEEEMIEESRKERQSFRR